MDNHLKEEVEILENMLLDFEPSEDANYFIDKDEARAFFKVCEQVGSEYDECIGVTSEFLQIVASCVKDYKKKVKKDLKEKIKKLQKQVKEME